MASLTKYFKLIKEHPQLFVNPDEDGIIRIITDPETIKLLQAEKKKEYKEVGKKPKWIDIGMLSEDPWFWVLRDLVEFPDGKIGGYIRFINRKSQEGGFNVVLMCVQSDRVLMIKRFRHEERNWSWEFPRGFGEQGLSAEENAYKELEEEIGIKNARLIQLTNVSEGQGGTAVYLAEIPDQKQIILELGEGISDYRWVSLSEFELLVMQGQLNDRFSLWAYALAKIKKVI